MNSRLKIDVDLRKPVTSFLMATLLSATANGVETQGLYFALTAGQSSIDIPESEVNSAVVESFNDGGLDTSLAGSSLDDSDGVFGAHIGYSFNPYVALEIGYIDLGEADQNTDVDIGPSPGPITVPITLPLTEPVTVVTRFSTSGPTLALVGSFPFAERFEVHGRGGLYFSDTRVQVRFRGVSGTALGSGGGDKESDTDLFAGIGLGWRISEAYELRLDYQRFLDVGKDSEADVDLVSLSFLFR